jgi:hypothetical protein
MVDERQVGQPGNTPRPHCQYRPRPSQKLGEDALDGDEEGELSGPGVEHDFSGVRAGENRRHLSRCWPEPLAPEMSSPLAGTRYGIYYRP